MALKRVAGPYGVTHFVQQNSVRRWKVILGHDYRGGTAEENETDADMKGGLKMHTLFLHVERLMDWRGSKPRLLHPQQVSSTTRGCSVDLFFLANCEAMCMYSVCWLWRIIALLGIRRPPPSALAFRWAWFSRAGQGKMLVSEKFQKKFWIFWE